MRSQYTEYDLERPYPKSVLLCPRHSFDAHEITPSKLVEIIKLMFDLDDFTEDDLQDMISSFCSG